MQSLMRLAIWSPLLTTTLGIYRSYRMKVETGVKLAPAYDMLPMYYRPKDGELPRVDAYSPSPVLDSGQDVLLYAAEAFCKAAADDVRISDQFRKICLKNAAVVMRSTEGPRVF